VAEPRRARWWIPAALALIAIAVIARGSCGARDADRASAAPSAGGASARGASAPLRRGGVAIPYARRAELRGRVVRPDGAVVAGATVRLLARPAGVDRDDAPPARVATTDAAGTFTFGAQTLGGYVLEAQRDDDVSPTAHHELTAGSRPVTLMLLPGASVQIEVVRARDGAPIAGADVRLSGGDGDFATDVWRTAITDDDGIARVRGVTPTANHAVIVHADGYVDALVNLVEGAFPERTRWGARVALDEGAMLAGRVVDERGTAVAGARVGFRAGQSEPVGVGVFSPFLAAGRAGTVASDADGRFRVAARPGAGCLVATHPEHLLAERCGIEARLGVEQGGLDLVLGDGAFIAGRVVDGDGAPVPGATVLVTMRGQDLMPRFYADHRFVTRSGEDGRFAFRGLDAVPIVVYAYTADASSELVDVDLTAPPPPDDIELALEHRGVITGAVVDGSGAAIPWATVRFRPNHLVDAQGREDPARIAALGGEPPASWTMTRTKGAVRADAGGRFRIEALPEGAYSLDGERATATSVPANYGTGRQQVVRTGEDTRVVVPSLGRLRGRVVTDTGAAARVQLSLAIGGARADESMYPPGRGFADGRFELGEVPAQTYSVQITGDAIAAAHVTGVEIRAGGTTDLGTIRVRRGVAREGRVVTRDRAPVGGAQVTIELGDRTIARASDPGGAFEIPTVAEDITVRARATTESGASEWVTAGRRGERVELVLTEAPSGAVDGVVVGGDALEGRVVAAVEGAGSPEELPVRAAATTAAGGRFTIASLPPGTYRLWLRRPEADRAAPEWQSDGAAIEVRAGQTTRAVVRASIP
jgi:hypothetical protein